MIYCCMDCKAPKRYPGCHGTCPDYIKEKAEHDAERAEENRKRSIEHGLNAQKASGVKRAKRNWYNKKGR